MLNDKELKFSKQTILIPILSVVIIWFVYWLEINFNYNFNKFGVFPRTIKGFRGVFLSPFIHSNTSHLFNNSIPLFIFLTSLLFFYKKVALKVLVYGGLLTGLFTWIIARDSYHIGASGIVYLLFSFIFFSGILKRHLRLISLSLVVIFLYGSMIWYVLPIKEGMSWEGHLSGFVAGIIFAFLYKGKGIVKEEFQFTQTEFDEMFDEEGNLILQEEIYETNLPEESDNLK
ncbi:MULTISPECIES: rhomboid family intramembrane serine protease [Tenacibaculum]|uniref:rhomboid family intramembrane serine protease n=1 Tax=Tenacibaculum TaxID=104267 RepID=UPI001F0AC57A|nr:MULTISPECIES: rhomboid family intramembrane serine protease [Tenacibaculum]MCH3880848.1 rhomboid family intramembrane serine protease [Tenacibaculum aquimarinum]MDO6599553.1 rhomboid family intramembrane serine protease [Tenacibaculum sp. 1_MG-2023]